MIETGCITVVPWAVYAKAWSSDGLEVTASTPREPSDDDPQTTARAEMHGYFDFRDRLARQIRRASNGEAPYLRVGPHEAIDFAVACGARNEVTASEWAEQFLSDLRRHREKRRG